MPDRNEIDAVEVDIRPMAVDLLATLPVEAIVQRCQRTAELMAIFERRGAALRTALDEATATHRFLVQEHDNAVLAQRLQAGEVVRIICPGCRGSGLKPSDVLSGQLHRKSAFESIGETMQRIEPLEAPEAERCVECGGKRWVLMERYRG